MGKHFDQLKPEQQQAVLEWASNETAKAAGGRKMSAREKDTFRAQTAEQVASDPTRVARIEEAHNSKVCVKDAEKSETYYVLPKATQNEVNDVIRYGILGGDKPKFFAEAKPCSLEDVTLANFAIPLPKNNGPQR